MSHLEVALANLQQAQDAFDPLALELRLARSALKRSKSKANVARYTAASDAFDAAFDNITLLHDAVAYAEEQDAFEALQASEAQYAAIQPDLFA